MEETVETMTNGSRAAQFATVRSVEHTFTTGRSALLRESLPKMQLIRSGVLSDEMLSAFDDAARGELKDHKKAVELTDLLVAIMWIDPKIGPGDVPIDLLTDEEIQETLDLAFGGARAVEAFRGDEPRVDGGAGSADVERPAKPPARRSRGNARGVDH